MVDKKLQYFDHPLALEIKAAGLWTEAARKAYLSRGLQAERGHLFKQVLSDSVPTAANLEKWGCQVPTPCPTRGDLDT
eukprot:5266737-Pyramimonas_sp.AAC.1